MNRVSNVIAKGTPFQTEYHVTRANARGPVCMITAGVHGNEVAAPLVAKHFPHIPIKKGTLIVVPIVNKQAYRAGLRGRPDLNRTFPRANESARHPVSRELFQLAKEFRPAVCLDLHEGWGFHQLSPAAFGQTLITNPTSSLNPLIQRVIKKMNASIQNRIHQFSTRFSVLPGSYRTSMTQILGIPTVTVETAVSLPLSLRMQYQEKIVYNFLNYIGIL